VFHPLRVAAVERETDDAVAVTFDVPPELAFEYAYLPGQHVTVKTPEAGDELRRNYSICSAWDSPDPPPPRRIRIGVKRVRGGGFSSYAIERMRPGDVVDVMTPTGRFFVRPDPSRARDLCFVAAGSGITPILSMCASVLAVEQQSTVRLLYGNRTTSSIMFLEELADLKDRHPDRFQLVHVLSRERPEIELFAGRIDGEKLRAFLDTLIPAEAIDGWYLCGPMPMMQELRQVLAGRGVPRTSVHTELYHVTGMAASTPAAAVRSSAASGPVCEVTATLGGRTVTFPHPYDGPPVLEGVLAVRRDAPFACRGGVCGTCRAKVREGSVRMDQCYALEPDEVAQGYVLTCQAHPTSERLVVDYDT
jgi:ring-1,2-phenylacetyl-CoA epoxidase subunit PaaE